MRNKKLLMPSILIGAILTLFSLSVGCKKDNDSVDDNFQSTAEDIGQAESVSSDVENMTSEVSRIGTFNHDPSSSSSMDQFNFHSLSCAIVTNDSINHIITFDFGSGCTGNDNKTRSGKVIVTYNGTGYFDAGSSWVVTFDNFYVNNRHVEGIRSVTNNGLNSSGNMTWSIDAQNMRITRPDGSWRSWSSIRTREMIAGFGDHTWENDEYLINGTSSGLNSNGESVSCILTNIRRQHSCHFITSGTLEITPTGKPNRTIDFGDGTCDDLATVSKNGITRTIHLRF